MTEQERTGIAAAFKAAQPLIAKSCFVHTGYHRCICDALRTAKRRAIEGQNYFDMTRDVIQAPNPRVLAGQQWLR